MKRIDAGARSRSTGDRTAVRVRGLVKSYGAERAVRGVDFDIARGEVFALLGPNGAGKTTTVEILEGFRSRTAGEVSVLGFDPADRDPAMRASIGVVMQSCGFDQYLTVAETLESYRASYPSPKRIEEVLQWVQLEPKHGTRVLELSGGQLRRLDLAVALVGNPKLLFLDEPTTGFDPAARRATWELIRDLRAAGMTILLTTHFMDEAEALADRVAIMSAGRIVAEGMPSALGSDRGARVSIRCILPWDVEPPNDVRGEVVLKNGALEIRTPDPVSSLNALTRWALDRGISLAGLDVSRPSLEEVYLELIGREPHIEQSAPRARHGRWRR